MTASIIRNCIGEAIRCFTSGARIKKAATPSPEVAPWAILRTEGRTTYAFCRPGAPKYIHVPQDLFSTGAASAQHHIILKDLHMNCQHSDGKLPLGYASTKEGENQYIFFPESVRVVKSLETSSCEDTEFELHPKCRGARHYFALNDESFYLIFQFVGDSGPEYLGARTSSLRNAANWKEFKVPEYLRAADAIMFDRDQTSEEAGGNYAIDGVDENSSKLQERLTQSSGSLLAVPWRDASPALTAFRFSCGEPRATGSYKLVGWRNNRPEYNRVDDTDAAIYWNTGGEWVSYVENYKGSSSLYRKVSLDCSPPLSNWQSEEGIGPTPTVNALGLHFVLSNALHGNLLVHRMKGAVSKLGLDLSDIDFSSLTLVDAKGSPVDTLMGQTNWTSFTYPILCICSIKDIPIDYILPDFAALLREGPMTKQLNSLAAPAASEANMSQNHGEHLTKLDSSHTPNTSSSCELAAKDKMIADIALTENTEVGEAEASPPKNNTLEDTLSIGVLRGVTITKYSCDEWLQPCISEYDLWRNGILSKNNICQSLTSLMARVKVRPTLKRAPFTKMIISPQMEWALEALQQIRQADSTIFERALGVASGSLKNDTQSILDMLADIGPRLQSKGDEAAADAIEREFDQIIGLAQVKAQIRQLRKGLQVDMKRRAAGVHVPDTLVHHMLFVGNPGVGKTMLARLVAKILREVGVVKGGCFVEVQREDLVAQYIGQTAPKTRQKIQEAKGGVLFVDEAYRLTDASSGSDFGPEALDEIMKDLECGDPLVIIAGYPDKMQRFLDTNPGLRRRFRNFFHFSDYTAHEIADMFMLKVCSQGFFLESDVTVDMISNLITDHTTMAWRAERNGGVASRLFDNAKSHLDNRICLEGATKWELQTFSADDLRHAAHRLQGDARSTL